MACPKDPTSGPYTDNAGQTTAQPLEFLQLFVRSDHSSEEYELPVHSSTTVAQVKTMAMVHFNTDALTSLSITGNSSNSSTGAGDMAAPGDGPAQGNVTSERQETSMETAEGGGGELHGRIRAVGSAALGSGKDQYSLMHVGDLRRLASEETLHGERVSTGANLLLMTNEKKSKASTDCYDQECQQLKERAMAANLVQPLKSGPAATMSDVRQASQHLPYQPNSLHNNKLLDMTLKRQSKAQCQLLLRRVLLGVAQSSLRLLGGPEETQQAFEAIMKKLEKRHRSNIQPASIRKLQEMGFSECQAAIAFKQNNSVDTAAEWLLENNPHEYLPSPLPPRQLTDRDDPVEVLMPFFWQFRRSYFLPNVGSYKRLLVLGYPSTRALDALLQMDNDEADARELLQLEVQQGEDLLYSPPPPTHPIMMSIRASPVLQSGLNKPKVLYALLALCESPKNANLWLSDPDTRDVVTIILKLHHQEQNYREYISESNGAPPGSDAREVLRLAS